MAVLAAVPEKRRQARRAPEVGEFRFLAATPPIHRAIVRDGPVQALVALAREHVRANFLHTRELRDYVAVFLAALRGLLRAA